MNIDISPIVSASSMSVHFELKDVHFKDEDIKNTSIVELKNCNVSGIVTKLEEDVFSLEYTFTGTMVLEDSVTLEKIDHDFKIEDKNDYEIGNYLKINENLLDIYEVLWENVVLEVPLRIVKDDSLKELEGDGWSLNKQTVGNSGLSELSKLLDMEERK